MWKSFSKELKSNQIRFAESHSTTVWHIGIPPRTASQLNPVKRIVPQAESND
jgi:hypothetical protein